MELDAQIRRFTGIEQAADKRLMALHRRSSDGQASDSDVVEELTEMAFLGLMPTIVLGAAGLIGTTIQVAVLYHDRFLWIFSCIMTLVFAVRAVMALRVQRAARSKVPAKALRRVNGSYTAASLLYYSTLACTTIYCFRNHIVAAQVISIVGIFIMCTGINGRTVASPIAAKAGGILLLAALGIAVYHPHDPVVVSDELLIAVFAVAHCQAVQGKYDVAVQQIRARRKLRLLSEHDPLTGLVNRRRFEVELETLCERENTFAILFIDLDRFKPVNDTYGHRIGDALLKSVAERLLATVRKEDIVARLGGDEFAVLLLPATSHDGARLLASRINKVIAEPFSVDSHSISIGTSIGVAVSSPGGAKPSELLHLADEALYRSKEAGRGGFVMAS